MYNVLIVQIVHNIKERAQNETDVLLVGSGLLANEVQNVFPFQADTERKKREGKKGN